jgi:ribonuclease VapC
LSVFVDASALVAILAGEDDAESLANRLEAFPSGFVSPIVIFETTLALSRLRGIPRIVAKQVTEDFLRRSNLTLLSIDAAVSDAAIAASEIFGKGLHKARLNMGDCFSYACAKVLEVPLLCKGDDFIHTDIRIA